MCDVIWENFTVKSISSKYLLSRYSELGRLDRSPNPEDLHGLVWPFGRRVKCVPQPQRGGPDAQIQSHLRQFDG